MILFFGYVFLMHSSRTKEQDILEIIGLGRNFLALVRGKNHSGFREYKVIPRNFRTSILFLILIFIQLIEDQKKNHESANHVFSFKKEEKKERFQTIILTTLARYIKLAFSSYEDPPTIHQRIRRREREREKTNFHNILIQIGHERRAREMEITKKKKMLNSRVFLNPKQQHAPRVEAGTRARDPPFKR